ncbi:hypothetical protein [Roseateles saccharophilus]|uniref:Uncharacterized protein n=1 Tax=Roseateles saccharophilus TaxID=304 RepID=A0A4V2VSX0_ROSSA|nr:hypothetical protein [Roseateles saccharophilus]MDG0832528.1 hypothetical protein [Roseateles saccharophilus]TCV03990.1 hypothetical protein EV671_1002260 [Roseateles saccharophilus]
MDYRSLLAIPLAALALSASGADKLRQPSNWIAGASYAWPSGATHEAGVAPETETSGQRALTVRSIGKRAAHEAGSISQFVPGYAGKRVRFSAQVKSAAADGWGGIVVASSYQLLFLSYLAPEFDEVPPLGAAGCPDWCDVSVVADIPADDGSGAISVGLALVGSGQVWARGVKLETVGEDVPLTTQRFGVEAAAAFRVWLGAAQKQFREQLRNQPPSPPQNLSLQ